MNVKKKILIKFIVIISLAILAGLISYPKAIRFFPPAYNQLNKLKVNLGLDLQGGFDLQYKADISNIESEKVSDALQAAQDVMERRVNPQGVSEATVVLTKSGDENIFIVEIPTADNIEEVKKRIQEFPILEFREEGEVSPDIQKIFDNMNAQSKLKAEETLVKTLKGENFEDLAKELSQDPGSKDKGGDLGFVKKGTFVPEFDKLLFEGNLKQGEVYSQLVESNYGWHVIKFIESRGDGDEKEIRAEHILFSKNSPKDYPQFRYQQTGLTGKNLESAQVVFPQGQGLGTPEVSINFDDEGTRLFADITKRNIEKPLAIFLDGQLQSAPNVQTEITNGEAVITGNFSIEEAKDLVRRLNEGALPVPLELIGQRSIEASLGAKELNKSLIAGIFGIGAVMIFMIAYYRFLGLIASVSLLIYAAFMVAIFKLSGFLTPWPITLSLSGIAGFILSLGMAVDANVLIFERTKEELQNGKGLGKSIDEGFRRAWPSIKDGNISTILTSVILIMIGTSFVKGFALILVIGVLMSMFTAIVVVKIALKFLAGDWMEKHLWIIIPTGFENKSKKDN